MTTPNFRRGAKAAEGPKRSRTGLSLIEMQSLDDGEKEQLCLDLLTEFGAEVVSISPDGEMLHSCCLPFGHTDSNPSASLNYKTLLYNCYVCGGGSILWLIGMCRDITGEEARSWVIKRTGLEEGRSKEQLLTLLDNIFKQVSESPPPMPHMGDEVLKPWMLIHPYLTEIRHVPEQTVIDFKVGYDPDKDRIIFPHYWKGRLVGWQSRRLVDDGTPKYLNTPDFPKDRTIYNYSERSQAVVVESVMSVLRHVHHCPVMEATFGAEIPDAQIRLLGQHDRVILWMDNDKAGWNATERLIEHLTKSTDVWVVPSPWAADPGDMDDDTFGTLLAEAVPYPLWHRPEELQTWEVAS